MPETTKRCLGRIGGAHVPVTGSAVLDQNQLGMQVLRFTVIQVIFAIDHTLIKGKTFPTRQFLSPKSLQLFSTTE